MNIHVIASIGIVFTFLIYVVSNFSINLSSLLRLFVMALTIIRSFRSTSKCVVGTDELGTDVGTIAGTVVDMDVAGFSNIKSALFLSGSSCRSYRRDHNAFYVRRNVQCIEHR